MHSNHKKFRVEIPESEQAEELISDEQEEPEEVAPLGAADTIVSETDWVDQQKDVLFDEEERDDT
ncbi:MAG TPA: hypothetical protein H9884_05235 [Candidatus Yaniella excrementigallinarum]|nr:hypothetical protein [Candidatus Yaniella excrementigallinarum]